MVFEYCYETTFLGVVFIHYDVQFLSKGFRKYAGPYNYASEHHFYFLDAVELWKAVNIAQMTNLIMEN